MAGHTTEKKMAVDFPIGGSAAVAKAGATPVERVKLLLQNQGEMMKRGHLMKPYSGIGDCFSRVVREEGFFCLWRGNQANVIRYFPTQVFNFAFRGYFQSLFGCSKEKDGYAKWFAGNVASGIDAGATISLLLYHLVYAHAIGHRRNRMPCRKQAPIQRTIGCLQKTLSSEGFASLYRGFGVSIMGITWYRDLYFGIYDTMKPIVLIGQLEGNFFTYFSLGWRV